MGWNCFATTGFASTYPDTTPAIDSTGATLIVIGYACTNWQAPSLYDSCGNSWTLWPGSYVGAGNGYSTFAMFYCVNPIASTNHTFSNGGYHSALAVLAFNGESPAVDQSNSYTFGPGGQGSTVVTGWIMPTENNALLITGTGNFNAPAYSASGFTSITYSNAGDACVGMGYAIQATSAAVQATWAVGFPGYGTENAGIMDFIPSAPAASPTSFGPFQEPFAASFRGPFG